jgi:hypothetical protein
MSKALFRWVVAGSIALLIGSVVVLIAVGQSLPPELSAWVDAEANSEWRALDTYAAVIAVISVVASVGLLFFARWSRWVYAASTIAVTVVTLFGGPSVSSAFEAFFSELVLLLDGFIIGTAFFSDVRLCFERTST